MEAITPFPAAAAAAAAAAPPVLLLHRRASLSQVGVVELDERRLAVDRRRGCARLVQVDPNTTPVDRYQQWRREDWVGRHAIDGDGNALFAVVNPATGYALRHDGGTLELKKVNVPQELLDESVMWVDRGDGGLIAKPDVVKRRIVIV